MLLHDAARAQKKREAKIFKHQDGKAGGVLYKKTGQREEILKHLSISISFIINMKQEKRIKRTNKHRDI